jgi:hypothetical protein
MSQPQVKWIGLASFLEVARETIGNDAWAKLEERLPPETRSLLAAPPAPITWIDVDHYFAILDALTEHGGSRRGEIVREVARTMVARDLRGIHRLFVRMFSPEFIAKRAAALYGTYWRDHGEVRVEPTGPRTFEVVYEGLSNVRMPFIQAQMGAIEAALDASGIVGLRVTLQKTSAHGFRVRASWG